MASFTGSESLHKLNYHTRGKYSPIGLDFGSGRIKMLQLKQQYGIISPHQLYHFPSPPSLAGADDSSSTALLAGALKKVLNNHNWRGNKAYLTLNSKDCYLRLMTLPAMSKRELKQALYWEASNSFPFDLSEAVISYMSLDQTAKKKKGAPGRYLLAATLKETANRYTDLALQAGLTPLSLETPSTALLRYIASRFNSEISCTKSYHLYIDLGYSSTRLLLTKNGGYCFHRNLQQGIKSICKSILEKTGSDYKTALRLLFEKAFKHEKSLAAEMENLIRSINDSLAYWSFLNGAAPITPATLTVGGGGSLIVGLTSFLQQNLNIQPARDLTFQDLDCRLLKKQLKTPEQTALFPVAHGLALRGWLK